MLVTLDTLTSDGGPGDSENVQKFILKHTVLNFKLDSATQYFHFLSANMQQKCVCITHFTPKLHQSCKRHCKHFTYTHVYRGMMVPHKELCSSPGDMDRGLDQSQSPHC